MRAFTTVPPILVLTLVLSVARGKAQEPQDGAGAAPTTFTATEFQRHVEYLASDELAGRAPDSEGSTLAAQYVIEQLEQCGCEPLLDGRAWLQEFPLDVPDKTTGALFGRNILAVRRGQGPLADEAVIVSAHYDHLPSLARPTTDGADVIFNGADDNASGVAAMLMIAAALADAPDPPGDNRRTVIFASFDAEEQGLRGAKHYVKRPAWPLDKTRAVINFDCIGRLRMDKMFVFDVETNPALARCVRDAAQRRGLVAETRLGSHGRSDHVEFLAHEIPSMHFFTGAHADYHKVTDESDRVNHAGGAAIAAIAYEVLLQASTMPGEFEFRPLDPSFDIALILKTIHSLGVVPNVSAQGGRYPQILAVVPDSPAARQGLASGDQITAIDGLRFERVEDALGIFQQVNLYDGVRLTVLRDDVELDVELPAELFADLLQGAAMP